jgi:outer membrane protein W
MSTQPHPHPSAPAPSLAPARLASRAGGFLGLLLVPLVASSWPAALEAQEPSRFTLRGYGAFLSPTGDAVSVDHPESLERTTHTVTEDGSGFGLSAEYRWRPRLGVELGVLVADVDSGFRLESGSAAVTDVEAMGIESVSLGLNWHLAPERRFDFALGVFVAQTTFDDVIFLTEAGRPVKLTFDDDHGFGVKAGLEAPFRRGGPWVVGFELRYLITILESEIAGQDLDLDPVLVLVGVGYRF